MKTRAELLDKWAIAVSKMHIGHHLAAASCTTWHLFLGVSATVLAAVVTATMFATLTKLAEKQNPTLFFGVALASMLSPALTAAVTFLKLDERALRHTRAAASFAGLRRQIEEALVKFAENEPLENLSAIQSHWREVIKESPPLPGRMYRRAVKQLWAERA
jgi:hypothetical protein